MIQGRRGGSALLEVLLALAIGMTLIVSARTMVVQLFEFRITQTAGMSTHAREAIAYMRLRHLIQSGARGTPYSGSVSRVEFTGRCPTPYGHYEWCDLTLHVSPGSDGSRLEVTARSLNWTFVAMTGEHIEFRYLADAFHGGQWADDWHFPVTRPVAIAVLVGSDTLLFRTGAGFE